MTYGKNNFWRRTLLLGFVGLFLGTVYVGGQTGSIAQAACDNSGHLCIGTDGVYPSINNFQGPVSSIPFTNFTGTNGAAIYLGHTGMPVCPNSSAPSANGDLATDPWSDASGCNFLGTYGNIAGTYTVIQLLSASCVGLNFQACLTANSYGTWPSLNGAGISNTSEFTITPLLPVSVYMQYPSEHIQIPYTQNATTSLADFRWFGVTLSNGFNPQASLQVSYDPSSTLLFTPQAYGLDSLIGGAIQGGLTSLNSVLKTKTLPCGTWYVQAEYLDIENFYSTTSQVSSFSIACNTTVGNANITSSTAVYYGAGTGNSSSSTYGQVGLNLNTTGLCNQNYVCTATNTTGLWDGLQCSLVAAGGNLLSFLICPNNFSVDSFNSSVNNFQKAPPFNVVFQTLSDASNTAAFYSTSTPHALQVSFPAVGTAPAFNIPLISTNTLVETVGQSTHDAIFAFETAFVWIGATFASLGIILNGS